jgi:formamidopyrimidine-DNA glycosylase
VPRRIEQHFLNAPVREVGRRAKYLLLGVGDGTALIHLGMSGSLRVTTPTEPHGKHDHFDIVTDAGKCIRFNDPRKFGSLLWTTKDPAQHPLLASLGPEPLEAGFDGDYLWRRARGRSVAVKLFIMNANIVVGVGNIYASEALFRAGISPRRAAGRISRVDMGRLAGAIQEVLNDAITLGGTTLRDFNFGEGELGYFGQRLRVYDRDGSECVTCGTEVRHINQGQRSTYFCPNCQH